MSFQSGKRLHNECSMKERYNLQRFSKKENSWFGISIYTELSNKFSKMKDNKRSANIKWETLGRHQAYNTSSKRIHCA